MEGAAENSPVLVSAYLNGQAAWEGYVYGADLRIPVEAKRGENLLEIVPLNRGITLKSMCWEEYTEEPYD